MIPKALFIIFKKRIVCPVEFIKISYGIINLLYYMNYCRSTYYRWVKIKVFLNQKQFR